MKYPAASIAYTVKIPLRLVELTMTVLQVNKYSNYFAVDMANVDDADHVYVYRDFYGERPHSAFYGRRA